MKGPVGEASTAVTQFGSQTVALALQLAPSGIDHTCGVVKRLAFIFAKQIDGKVLHHITKEVLLTPSAEQPPAQRRHQEQEPPVRRPQRPLEAGQWAGAVDNVGGPILHWMLATMKQAGTVASIGNAASFNLNTTVFPFILRGVVLYGVDSNTASPAQRAAAWDRLADAHAAGGFEAIGRTTITLAEVPAWAERITRGETTGRVVVDVRG